MSHHGTYRDQITIQAVADMPEVEILVISTLCSDTAEKMKFSIKDFFSKCDQIRSFL